MTLKIHAYDTTEPRFIHQSDEIEIEIAVKDGVKVPTKTVINAVTTAVRQAAERRDTFRAERAAALRQSMEKSL